MIAFCSNKQRRNLILQTPGVNGLDYLEVLGNPGCGKQLALTFLKDARSLGLTPANISLVGDTTLQVLSIQPATVDDPLTVTVQLSGTGDYSPYTLTLVTSATDLDSPSGLDPQLNNTTFSFKAGCATPVDCHSDQCCPSNLAAPPDIHYLARDYDKFRQAMLDRISVLVPGWSEGHEADPGIALVEALAYTADRVSYLQDAVNTEAYINTARSRISLRRHARLVDYQVSEGANARAWVCLTAAKDNIVVPTGTAFYPLVPGLGPSVDHDSYAADTLTASPGPVFESMELLTLFPEQNRMEFYAWGATECCLPTGATSATLTGTAPLGAYTSLKEGRVLIFEEAVGPLTGDPADADPTRRWAVRLTSASTTDHSGTPLVDPLNPRVFLTNIEWNSEDALPFPLCIASVTPTGIPVPSVSVARGNVVATDQGVWTINESLGTVPPAPPAPVAGTGCNCSETEGARVPRSRYEPVLANAPLTFAAPYSAAQFPSATSFLTADIASATPQVSVESDDGNNWSATEDLLSKDSEFYGFIPEIEWDGTAHLRFGDGTYGEAPAAGLAFSATYRTGNGAAGNVGREALAHILIPGSGITGVRNPLAAAGGTDAETMQHIVQVAPFAFQSQMRCVTAADYGTMAAQLNGVSEARGTIRWTGSWYSAFVSVDPAAVWNSGLQTKVKTSLDVLRMMGTDLIVEEAVFVGLNISLQICVSPRFFQADVFAAVWKLLVTGDTCTGATGLMNAANFQFGQTVYASPIVAAAQSVTGVAAVQLITFERMAFPTPAGKAPPTQLTMGAVEIPRCDNDPNHADHGLLKLIMDGGK